MIIGLSGQFSGLEKIHLKLAAEKKLAKNYFTILNHKRAAALWLGFFNVEKGLPRTFIIV